MAFSIQIKGKTVQGLTVVGFSGTEAISEIYVFRLYLQCGAPGLPMLPDDVDALVGSDATLVRDGHVHHGIIADLEVLFDLGGVPIVCATLVPRLWYLTLSRHTRVLVPESIGSGVKNNPRNFVAHVLSDYSLSVKSDIAEPGTERYFVHQYRESDFSFTSRWMEREGYYYYFEHEADAETEKLVLAEASSTQSLYDETPIPYTLGSAPLLDLEPPGRGKGKGSEQGPPGGGGSTPSKKAALVSFRKQSRLLPKEFRVAGYDSQNPDVPAEGEALPPTGTAAAFGERAYHDPAVSPQYDSLSDAAGRYAGQRMQASAARQVVFRGEGTATTLRAGYFFKLDGADPYDAAGGEYLATRVEHRGLAAGNTDLGKKLAELDDALEPLTRDGADDTYRVSVTAIPKATQFRPPEVTPWPRVYGYERARIALADNNVSDDGYAQVDGTGRYRVELAHDEDASEKKDANQPSPSFPVRMMQPYAGNPEGFHFPLRFGTEVLLTFLGGDPDQPVIAGAVPNSNTPSIVGSGNKSQSFIRSAEQNRFIMDDNHGKPSIELYTPNHDSRLSMGEYAKGEEAEAKDRHTIWDEKEETRFIYMRTDGSIGIHAEKYITIAADMHKMETIKGDTYDVVMGSSSDTVMGASNGQVLGLSTEVMLGGAVSFTLGGEQSMTIGGAQSMTIGGEESMIIGGEKSVTIGGGQSMTVGGEQSLLVGSGQSITAGGENSVILGPEQSLVLGPSTSTCIGPEMNSRLGGANSFTLGTEAAIVVGGKTDTTLGMEQSTTLGVELAMKAAAVIELLLAVKVEIHLGAKIELTPTPIELKNSKIEGINSTISSGLTLARTMTNYVFN